LLPGDSNKNGQVLIQKTNNFSSKHSYATPKRKYSMVCESSLVMDCCDDSSGAEMGLGAGGKIKQEIYPDSYGFDTWDQDNYGQI